MKNLKIYLYSVGQEVIEDLEIVETLLAGGTKSKVFEFLLLKILALGSGFGSAVGARTVTGSYPLDCSV